jgi:hypothetical protein
MRTDDFRLWLTLIASALCPEMVTRLDGQMGSAHGLIGSGRGARHEPHAWVRGGKAPSSSSAIPGMPSSGNAIEHVTAPEQPAAEIHELGHRPSVANQLEKPGGDEGDCLHVARPQAARESFLREKAWLAPDSSKRILQGQLDVPPVACARNLPERRTR